jgi:hypothetical protein
MAERKEQVELKSKIIAFFDEKAAEGWIMLTIPDISKGLATDRRKVENALVEMSKQQDPNANKLAEIQKGRIKYYILRDVLVFCQNRLKDEK